MALGFLWFVVQALTVPVFDSKRLIAQAAPAVEALQRYHAEHGRFPDSLEQAGIQLPETHWGPWRYKRLSPDVIDAKGKPTGYSESCELAVGDYMEDGFVVFWYPDTGWGVDR